MILPNMTPEEKVRQMEKLCPLIDEISDRWVFNKDNYRKVTRTKYFPACYTKEVDLSSNGMGKWTFAYIVTSKSNARKGVVLIRAYQKFYVSHSKNPSNNGIGIYVCSISGSSGTDGTICEYPPHYFNRIRERMIEPRGIVQPSFDDLAKRVLCNNCMSLTRTMIGGLFQKDADGMYSWKSDHSNDRQYGFNNIARYHKNGISLGIERGNYTLLLTYVPNNMLHSNQKEEQNKWNEEFMKYELRLRYNPLSDYSMIVYDPNS